MVKARKKDKKRRIIRRSCRPARLRKRKPSNYRKKRSKRRRSKKNQRGGMDADPVRAEAPLTDFESKCIGYYLRFDSDPFNLKLRGIDVDITRDDWWKEPVPLKYFDRDINTMSESQLVELVRRRGGDETTYKSWFERTTKQPHVKKINDEWFTVRSLGMNLIGMNTTIDAMIEGISGAIKNSTVENDVVVFRGLDIESIDSFDQSDPAFKSFTTDINVILNSEGEYLNSNGCCVLRTKLNKGMHAYYDFAEKQYVLDKDVRFSEPVLVQHPQSADFKMYHVNII